MRHTLAVTSLALSLGLSVLSANAWSSDEHRLHLPQAARAAASAPSSPRATLARAQAVLSGDRAGDATLALRDLFASLPRLSGSDRAAAQQTLARPSQPREECSTHVCVHWATTGTNAASAAWAHQTLQVMDAVWRLEIDRLGYRAPAPDHGGGDQRLDVYLQDVGSQGLYGYCEPESVVPGTHRRRASGYCVLDDDFARAQFGTRPVDALRVTAAHEFFHASQFNYDYLEDHWFMEATATWMEERFADDVNDNRQYLPASQVAEPDQPLDTFDQYGSNQYGNWVFFEYLSQRWGLKVVHRIWEEAVGAKRYSTKAVAAGLPGHHELARVYAAFTAANTTPGKSYEEGSHWPRARASQVWLGAGEDTTGRTTIDHLASVPVRVRPRADLDTTDWNLEVAVDGPASTTSPEASIVSENPQGAVQVYRVPLDDTGVGERTVPFDRIQVERMYVVLTNASTRFSCGGDDPTYSCGGTPKDDAKSYDLTMTVVPR